ncbi:MAG: hypothetical protein EHM12_06985 [Dehalococcoidia bacterium]|nr:MAG: hypothetical protein EHM12_06985 [Dehalococcoidia bacterium]
MERNKFGLGRLVSWFVFIMLPFIMKFVDFVDDDGITADADIHILPFLTASIHEFIVPLEGKLGLVDIRWGMDFEKETWHTFEYA